MKSLSIKDIGPIESLSMPLPDGGFVVLKGGHGTGKTTTLKAIESLVKGDGSLDKRDGSIEGRVEGFGATISVKKQLRRAGNAELQVDSLTGRFELSDLVDPHIKDLIAADAHRIKALVQLAGVKPEVELFHGLLGGATEFQGLVGELDADDLVSLAKKVKAEIEKAARDEESNADKASGAAEAHRKAAGEYAERPGPTRDLAALNVELEQAIRDEAKIKADAKSAGEAKRRADEAMEMLEDAKTAYQGLTVDAATEELEAARKAEGEANMALKAAQDAATAATAKFERAMERRNEALQHADNMAAWQKSIAEASNVTPPSAEEIDAAAKDVLHCREQIERAIAARAAREQIDRAETEDKIAKLAKANATRYRTAAANVDTVLTEAVGKLDCPLRVKNGRLVLDTDRGEEHFAELSDGERWALVFDIAIPMIPGNGLLTMAQAAYGELSPATRKDLNRKLKEKGVVCITAAVTDDQRLSATLFDEE